jgi:hypothetical protein
MDCAESRGDGEGQGRGGWAERHPKCVTRELQKCVKGARRGESSSVKERISIHLQIGTVLFILSG